MPRPYSVDLRKRVIQASEEGLSGRAAAERFAVSSATAARWVPRYRQYGEPNPRCPGQLCGSRLDPHADFILGQIDQHQDMTLAEIVTQLKYQRGVSIGLTAVWRWLDRHGITYKKTAHADEQQRPDVAAARQTVRDRQPALDPDKLIFIFIDETGASTKRARRYGRSPRGTRCEAPVPHGHWHTTTFIAGLRHCGISAPMVLDGTMDGAAFVAYTEQGLVPELRPGDIVVLDNLSTHKIAGARSKTPAPSCAFYRLTAPI